MPKRKSEHDASAGGKRHPLDPRLLASAKPTRDSGGFDFQKVSFYTHASALPSAPTQAITDSYSVEIRGGEPLPVELTKGFMLRFTLPNTGKMLFDLNRSTLDMTLAVETEDGKRPVGEQYRFTIVNEPGLNLIRYMYFVHKTLPTLGVISVALPSIRRGGPCSTTPTATLTITLRSSRCRRSICGPTGGSPATAWTPGL